MGFRQMKLSTNLIITGCLIETKSVRVDVVFPNRFARFSIPAIINIIYMDCHKTQTLFFTTISISHFPIGKFKLLPFAGVGRGRGRGRGRGLQNKWLPAQVNQLAAICMRNMGGGPPPLIFAFCTFFFNIFPNSCCHKYGWWEKRWKNGSRNEKGDPHMRGSLRCKSN